MNTKQTYKKVDTKEFELPETAYVRDIENKVFQEIILNGLSKIPGITPVEGSFIETIFNKKGGESLKGIYIEQDSRNHSVSVKIEVKVAYGTSIPEKSEEIQTMVCEDITSLTGLHVSEVHVVFKGLINERARRQTLGAQPILEENIVEEYSDEF